MEVYIFNDFTKMPSSKSHSLNFTIYSADFKWKDTLKSQTSINSVVLFKYLIPSNLSGGLYTLEITHSSDIPTVRKIIYIRPYFEILCNTSYGLDIYFNGDTVRAMVSCSFFNSTNFKLSSYL